MNGAYMKNNQKDAVDIRRSCLPYSNVYPLSGAANVTPRAFGFHSDLDILSCKICGHSLDGLLGTQPTRPTAHWSLWVSRIS
jgi:hypothetical protein